MKLRLATAAALFAIAPALAFAQGSAPATPAAPAAPAAAPAAPAAAAPAKPAAEKKTPTAVKKHGKKKVKAKAAAAPKAN